MGHWSEPNGLYKLFNIPLQKGIDRNPLGSPSCLTRDLYTGHQSLDQQDPARMNKFSNRTPWDQKTQETKKMKETNERSFYKNLIKIELLCRYIKKALNGPKVKKQKKQKKRKTLTTIYYRFHNSWNKHITMDDGRGKVVCDSKRDTYHHWLLIMVINWKTLYISSWL